MKKTIYTVIATLLFLISSCTLEQEVYNKINPGMFPQNAEDVNALVNSSAYYVFSPWGIFEGIVDTRTTLASHGSLLKPSTGITCTVRDRHTP